MKYILLTFTLLFSVLTFAEENQPASFYCEADCGYVAKRSCFGGLASCPYYESCEAVFGEGSTMLEAFQATKTACDLKECVLHDGFIRNTVRAVELNTNVRPSTICVKQ
jgi:hypothetical protein